MYKNLYHKYLSKLNMQLGGATSSKTSVALKYAKQIAKLDIDYKWHNEEDDKKEVALSCDDKFWSANGKPPSAAEIKASGKSIVCSGLTNLMRRKVGFSIPGLNGNIPGQENWDLWKKNPGGTGAWYHYLNQHGRLIKFNSKQKYPLGTLLLQKWKSLNQQGHVAVVIDDKGSNILEQNIVHAIPFSDFATSGTSKDRVGATVIGPYSDYNDWFKVQFVCLPENWLEIN
jgi:hypothetical protein